MINKKENEPTFGEVKILANKHQYELIYCNENHYQLKKDFRTIGVKIIDFNNLEEVNNYLLEEINWESLRNSGLDKPFNPTNLE